MIKYFKIVLNIFKSSLRSKVRGILNGRYFAAVEFFNKKNIVVHVRSTIETGSRILVIHPLKTEINICIEGDCWIGRDVEIQTNYNSKIIIERNVSIQDRCKILGSVYIGQDSLLAPDVFLSSGNHYYNYLPELPIKQQDRLVVGTADLFNLENSPIVIEEDCWLGKNSMVKKGINIGRGAIIGANSFVVCNVPPYEIWAGSPAKFVKKRLDFIPPLGIQSDQIKDRPYFYKGFEHRNSGDGGFFSSNSSICILENSDRISVFISGKIYLTGVLKIWANDNLIFKNKVTPGSFSEILALTGLQDDSLNSSLYRNLPKKLKQYLCISFDYKSKESDKLKGFSINKIEYHG